MDAEKIKNLQENWGEASAALPTSAMRNVSEFHRILKGLEEMELDLAQDATYELLEDGLTKKTFDQEHCRAWLAMALDSYHQAQSLSTYKYLGEQPRMQYHGLKRLVEFTLPNLEQHLAESGLPDDVSELRLIELRMLQETKASGALDRAVKLAANGCAMENTRSAYSYLKRAKEKQAEMSHLQECREGLAYANAALEAIDNAQEFYAPKEITLEYDGFGGWKDEKGPYNREILTDMKEYFLLQESAIEFHQAYKFHQEGHYVLDASGSGHGMMRMPMQHIAEKLKEEGYNIRDPKLFEQMGTDIDTFWNAYETERQNVIKDDKYKLVKPQLKR